MQPPRAARFIEPLLAGAAMPENEVSQGTAVGSLGVFAGNIVVVVFFLSVEVGSNTLCIPWPHGILNERFKVF